MKIGLYNLEHFINNTALMQVSKYHKDKGDDVELYIKPFKHTYDKIYAFSLFDYTPKDYVTSDIICGGTGFDINSKLPPEIETTDLDYSIYPRCKTSYLWFSRGCINNCPFCVVRKKEGKIHPVKHKNLNPDSEYITIMDNNFFANSKWNNSVDYLQNKNLPIDIQQGMDLRIMTEEQMKILNSFNHYKQIRFAWDNPKTDMIPKLKLITKYIKPYKLMCYVLIGYWSSEEQDLYRIETLRKLKIDPFVMPYNKNDLYQRSLARWVNDKAVFKSCTWEEYKKGKRLIKTDKGYIKLPKPKPRYKLNRGVIKGAL